MLRYVVDGGLEAKSINPHADIWDKSDENQGRQTVEKLIIGEFNMMRMFLVKI